MLFFICVVLEVAEVSLGHQYYPPCPLVSCDLREKKEFYS